MARVERKWMPPHQATAGRRARQPRDTTEGPNTATRPACDRSERYGRAYIPHGDDALVLATPKPEESQAQHIVAGYGNNLRRSKSMPGE